MQKNKIKKIARPRLLLVGCGDVGMRLLPLLRDKFRVFATTSQVARVTELRAAGAIPLVVNLDQPHTLQKLVGLAPYVVHLAPPQAEGAALAPRDFFSSIGNAPRAFSSRVNTLSLPRNLAFSFSRSAGRVADANAVRASAMMWVRSVMVYVLYKINSHN